MHGLRGGSRLVVIAWGVALAAGLAPRVPEASDAPSAAQAPRAQVRAVPVEPPAAARSAPEPPPAARSAPEPPPAQLRTPSAHVVEITPADLARGGDLLASGGRFPVISARYDGLASFGGYAAAMTALGARFVVVDRRRIVAEVDLPSGAIREAVLGRAFSPRARDYTDEPALADPARRVRARFGPGAEIMLLVPRALDAGLFAGIARELGAHGDGHAAYREIEGRYERAADGGLRFRLLSGLRMDGRRVALGAVFDLAAIAAAGAG